MKLYNSLTQKKENFEPLNKSEVKIYVCGITPYDTTHLGHAFTYVFFDSLIRYLRFRGNKVNYVQNVTDIDDDVLKRAKEEKRDWQELGNYWTEKFLADMKNLNVMMPTHYVKATDSIATIVKIVALLLEQKYAYEKNGNVYFEVNKFKDYGNLSHFTRKQMIVISKERGGDPSDTNKKDPLDFILWYKSKPGEPSWKSPWAPPAGGGRPGWHIECSAMNYDYLGQQIDIHGGGRDLIFPHHESEIAQSESYSGKKPFSKFFMHTAMVMYQGEKMSKSLGNLVMVSDLLKKYSSNEIRWVLLSHHYRTPWEFNEEELIIARKSLSFIKRTSSNKSSSKETFMSTFTEFIDDDFNSPKALDWLVQNVEKINKNDLNSAFDILGFTLQ